MYDEMVILRDVVRYLRRKAVAHIETNALGGLRAQKRSRRYDDSESPTEVNDWKS